MVSFLLKNREVKLEKVWLNLVARWQKSQVETFEIKKFEFEKVRIWKSSNLKKIEIEKLEVEKVQNRKVRSWKSSNFKKLEIKKLEVEEYKIDNSNLKSFKLLDFLGIPTIL